MDDMNFNDYNKDNANDNQSPTVWGANTSNGNGTERLGSFYSETHKKQKKNRGVTLTQLIAVSLISAILGGGVVFGAFQFVAPAIQPALGGYLNKVLPENSTQAPSKQTDNGMYKKVEITTSDSPVAAIAEKVSPSIVGIRVTAQVEDFFFGTREGSGEGSGIIVKPNGYIITNNHVIEGAISTETGKTSPNAKIEVFLPSQKDKPFIAKIIGRDAKTDLAILKIEATNLPAAEIGNSDKVRVGELAVAIGNPGGLDYMGSVTAGVISGINRTIKTEDGKNLTLIQTDAAINPGNSGGALLNSKGQVIGINTIKISASGFEGLGFAIPINNAMEISKDLMEYKYVKNRPWLGIGLDAENPVIDKTLSKKYNIPTGLLIGKVELASGAYKAGLARGDIITKFDGVVTNVFTDLENQKNKHKPGDKVKVVIYRMETKQTLTLEVTLGEDMSSLN